MVGLWKPLAPHLPRTATRPDRSARTASGDPTPQTERIDPTTNKHAGQQVSAPHTRGCAGLQLGVPVERAVGPAHAGMRLTGRG